MRRVVVTGLGAVTPVGNDVPAMWAALLAGKSGVGPIQSFDASAFESRIAAEVKGFDPASYISPKEIRRTERFTQLAIAAATQAVRQSGVSIEREDPFRCGVIIGSGMGSMHLIEEQHSVYLAKGPKKLTPFMIPMLICNMAPGHVAMNLGFKGPNFCTTTACASGAHGVGEAFRIIQRGAADVMLGGGTESCVSPMAVGGFCALMALSRRNGEPATASRPFDRERDGFVIGEGAGVLVLEELEHAKKRGAAILAEMAGYGLTADAYHMTAPDPEGTGAAKAMALALEDARMRPEDVTYLNAHGTSTELNDKIETLAIKKTFGPAAKTVAVSSTKSMTGHLIGAAGGVEAVISVLAITDGVMPPTINYEHPDPECDLDYVPNHARRAAVKAVLSNSLGFGGHNATVIFRKFHG
ncbi:MAG: beta-ketoacyl-[acyl-carrier-protein] synthase II [Omnitrophica WOR_2 bacterium RIFCSPHIGHO2_02_FULL_67_20]|nr:MAG: beta-ketoacyl-[acyl-carrier-protein] synthase II [Omnitrophica WOR_2 bacterium RIFCSPHIGHO2_02_FULL_67_20]